MKVTPPKNFKKMPVYLSHRWAAKHHCKLVWCQAENKTVIVRMH